MRYRKLTIRFVLAIILAMSVDFAFAQGEMQEDRQEEEILLGGKRIVGGEPTDISQHPWQVALRIGRYLCGGSVIAPHWILTAAHCLRDAKDSSEITVKMGSTDIVTQGSWIEVRNFTIHKGYDRVTNANDIALVHLANKSSQRSIPLMDTGSTLLIGQPLEVTGWGAIAEKGSASANLLKATVPYVATEECNSPDSYNGRILAGMMCAGYMKGGTDACQGDSGGPLVWRTSPDEPVLVGVVSFGFGCARVLKYGVYVRVAEYRDWINSVVITE